MDKYEMECAIASIQDALKANDITRYTWLGGHGKRLDQLEMLLFALIAELGYEVVLGPSVRIAKK